MKKEEVRDFIEKEVGAYVQKKLLENLEHGFNNHVLQAMSPMMETLSQLLSEIANDDENYIDIPLEHVSAYGIYIFLEKVAEKDGRGERAVELLDKNKTFLFINSVCKHIRFDQVKKLKCGVVENSEIYTMIYKMLEAKAFFNVPLKSKEFIRPSNPVGVLIRMLYAYYHIELDSYEKSLRFETTEEAEDAKATLHKYFNENIEELTRRLVMSLGQGRSSKEDTVSYGAELLNMEALGEAKEAIEKHSAKTIGAVVQASEMLASNIEKAHQKTVFEIMQKLDSIEELSRSTSELDKEGGCDDNSLLLAEYKRIMTGIEEVKELITTVDTRDSIKGEERTDDIKNHDGFDSASMAAFKSDLVELIKKEVQEVASDEFSSFRGIKNEVDMAIREISEITRAFERKYQELSDFVLKTESLGAMVESTLNEAKTITQKLDAQDEKAQGILDGLGKD